MVRLDANLPSVDAGTSEAIADDIKNQSPYRTTN